MLHVAGTAILLCAISATLVVMAMTGISTSLYYAYPNYLELDTDYLLGIMFLTFATSLAITIAAVFWGMKTLTSRFGRKETLFLLGTMGGIAIAGVVGAYLFYATFIGLWDWYGYDPKFSCRDVYPYFENGAYNPNAVADCQLWYPLVIGIVDIIVSSFAVYFVWQIAIMFWQESRVIQGWKKYLVITVAD